MHRLASAHAEAVRQHAAATDAHAFAAELHYEILAEDEVSDPASKQDAICASLDALLQTGTSSEASELTCVDPVSMRDALRLAKEALRLAEGGEDPRKAHAQTAKLHATLAEQHAQGIQAITGCSEEAKEALSEVENAFIRARDAEVAERAA